VTPEESWDAAEEAWAGEAQRKVDRIRVLGYAIVCIRRCDEAKRLVDLAVDRMLAARLAAERQLEALRSALTDAEEMGRLVALDDPDTKARIAQALEELEA
jgi:hypothetical protein